MSSASQNGDQELDALSTIHFTNAQRHAARDTSFISVSLHNAENTNKTPASHLKLDYFAKVPQVSDDGANFFEFRKRFEIAINAIG
ncbi:hypothetical protein PQX77_002244, partial [Marasmius sp. AFHP31]